MVLPPHLTLTLLLSAPICCCIVLLLPLHIYFPACLLRSRDSSSSISSPLHIFSFDSVRFDILLDCQSPPTIVIDKVSPLLVGYVLELLRIGWHCSHCSFFFCRFLDFSCMCMLLICFAVWHKSLVLRLMVGRQSASWPCCRFHWFNEKKREQREEEGSNYEFARRPINRNMYQRCACVCVDVKLGEMCGGLTLRMYVVRSPHNTKTSRRTWSLVSNDSSVNG